MKKVLCICFALAIVVAMISCQKECVCKKDVSYLENPDTTAVVDTTTTDSTATTTTDNSATMDSIMLNAHHIYDKRECEYLNISDTNVYEVTTLTCSMVKKEK